MYSSHNNRTANKAFKRALFALLLSEVDRKGSIPGNEEGVLYFVSFLVLVVVLLWRYMYFSLDIILSGGKNENRRAIIYLAGIHAIQTSASFVGRRVEELKYTSRVLTYCSCIRPVFTTLTPRHPINKRNAWVGV